MPAFIRASDLQIGDRIRVWGSIYGYATPVPGQAIPVSGLEVTVFGARYIADSLEYEHLWVESGTDQDQSQLYIKCDDSPLITRPSDNDASNVPRNVVQNEGFEADADPFYRSTSTTDPFVWIGWANVTPGSRVSNRAGYVMDVDHAPLGTIIVRIGRQYFYDPNWEHSGRHYRKVRQAGSVWEEISRPDGNASV